MSHWITIAKARFQNALVGGTVTASSIAVEGTAPTKL
jgi:hypothetical protein